MPTSTGPDPKRDLDLRLQVAALIKDARQREGLTQAEVERRLAALLGVSGIATTTLSRYERGASTPPWGTLAALCEVLTGRPEALAEALGEAFRRHERADT